ncbi:MAG: ABC transporter permease subunit [Ignavibacteriales bacterium]|nr:ABC transporter permease subunit [Ignavibacteriota bacterium]MCB0747009.1 ABC transporter permease subunit [Ignavibacteriota bacterium]MCB9247750.1 ABC transporter permease subunit [Ignavibacteriales bacterium]
MNRILKIVKYQIKDNIRSKWLIGFSLFFLIISYWLISFTGDSSKVILSLLNIVLIVIPLISIVFGTIYIYNNKNYITFMLSQPINRSSLYSGLYFGLVVPLLISFLFGIGLPVIFNLGIFSESWIALSMVFISGVFQILIFTALAFLIATLNDDKLKGLGISIFVWLFFTVIYDGLILFLLQVFQDYPIEKLALGLTLVNPIDIGRILTVLKFDISALMGYTGAIFENFFGKNIGIAISFLVLLFWFVLPFGFGLKIFSNKDI